MSAQIENISDQRTLDVFNNVSFGNAGISFKASEDDEDLKTTVAIHYRINGQAHTLAATAGFNITAPTVALNGWTIQPAGTTYYYLLVIVAGVAYGLPHIYPRTGDPDTTGLLLAPMPADACVFGIFKHVATAAFTPGTTDTDTGVPTFAAINSYPPNGDPTGFTYATVSA